jgi:hypothetical protein
MIWIATLARVRIELHTLAAGAYDSGEVVQVKKWLIALLIVLALSAFAATYYVHPVWLAVMKLEWREPNFLWKQHEAIMRGK